ncbi:hypothetical protein BaRGS_00016178, partial [Batillaria attramentaria]
PTYRGGGGLLPVATQDTDRHLGQGHPRFQERRGLRRIACSQWRSVQMVATHRNIRDCLSSARQLREVHG